jgi:hypothetical protein
MKTCYTLFIETYVLEDSDMAETLKERCMGTTDKYYERGYKDAQAIEAKHLYDLAEYVHKLADSIDEERSK